MLRGWRCENVMCTGYDRIEKFARYRRGVLIRDLESSDIAAMVEINQENTPALGDETRGTMQAILEWSSMSLGCDIDGELVGFCLVLPPGKPYPSSNYRWFSDRYKDFIYLDRVGFRAAHQGRGFGAALYSEVERRSTSNLFTLEVNLKPLNAGSIRFHQRLGFVEIGQQISTSGKLVSMMAKRLDG